MAKAWGPRDARHFPMPRGYEVIWAQPDPLAAAPEVIRRTHRIGIPGLFRRLDLGDLAAGRAVLHVVAHGLAKWSTNVVPRDVALRALENILSEVHGLGGHAQDIDLRGGRDPLLDPAALAEDFPRALSIILRKATRLLRSEDFELHEVRTEMPGLDEARTATGQPSAEQLASRRQEASTGVAHLHAALSELNRGWLKHSGSGAAYDPLQMVRFVGDAASHAVTPMPQVLEPWLDPERLEIRTACYVLRHVAHLSGRQVQHMLAEQGYRTREGRPYPYNSIPSYASQAKKSVRQQMVGAMGAGS